MIAAKNAKGASAAAKALADKKVDWKTVKLGEVCSMNLAATLMNNSAISASPRENKRCGEFIARGGVV